MNRVYGKEVDDKKAYGQRYMRDLVIEKQRTTKAVLHAGHRKESRIEKMVIIKNLVLDNSLCDQLSLANSGPVQG